ncbi:MAG: hypothetical protein J6I45_00985 [Clostridia bacterium]|nr:hypothetical protein [Clostridia bacterium]
MKRFQIILIGLLLFGLYACDTTVDPYEDIELTIYGPGEERTRFLSIELISYEYSDIYKFDEELIETK